MVSSKVQIIVGLLVSLLGTSDQRMPTITTEGLEGIAARTTALLKKPDGLIA